MFTKLFVALRTKSRVLSLLLTLLLVMLGAGLRLDTLRADLPSHFARSSGDFFDGYDNAHSARNQVLFGEMRTDGWDPMLYAPPYVLLQTLWFMVFEPSLKSVNAFAAVPASIMLVAWVMAFRRYGPWVGVLAAVFCALSYQWVLYSRLALFENVVVLFLMGAGLCLAADRITLVRAFGFGACTVLAYASKASAIFFLPAAVAAIGLAAWQATRRENASWRDSLPILGGALGGAALVLVPWLLLFRLPDAEQIAHYGRMWMVMARPGSDEQAIHNLTHSAPFVHSLKIDGALVVAFVVALLAGIRFLFRPGKTSPLILLCTLWLGGSWFIFSYFVLSPQRYIVPMFPPALVLLAWAFGQRWFTRPLWHRIHVTLAIGFVAFFVWANGSKLQEHRTHRTQTIRQLNREMAKLPEGSVIGGASVLFAIMDTPHKGVRIDRRKHWWYNGDHPIPKFGITHLLLTDHAEDRMRTFRRWPEDTAGHRRILQMHIGRFMYHLYELPAAQELPGYTRWPEVPPAKPSEETEAHAE